MLEDRDYMRQPEYKGPRWRPNFRLRWSWTLALLVVNAIVFVVELIALGYPPRFQEGNPFALSVEGIKHGYYWQFLTFQFLHAGFLHILFNSWAIFIFGREIEHELGPAKFLTLYFCSGVFGGIVQVIGGNFWPPHFGTAVVGASAGAMGLMAAFARLYPEQPLTIFIYFFPVTTRAKYLLWGVASLSLVALLFPQSPFALVLGRDVSNAAHLGGMAMGFIFVWFVLRARSSRLAETFRPARKIQPSVSPRVPPGKNPEDESVVDEVDPILDKISAHGIHSLTARERAILEAARKKMAQR